MLSTLLSSTDSTLLIVVIGYNMCMVLVLILLLFNHSVLISFLSGNFFFGIRRVSIMTSAITQEWVGFNTFAAATQTQLLQLLKRLKEEVQFLFFLLSVSNAI
jgi:hypothetical protein